MEFLLKLIRHTCGEFAWIQRKWVVNGLSAAWIHSARLSKFLLDSEHRPRIHLYATSALPEYRDTINTVEKQRKQSCKPLSGEFRDQINTQRPEYFAGLAVYIR